MTTTAPTLPIAPGAHILVRDAVWRVLQVNRTSTGKRAWTVVGISEIVRDQEAIFLEQYEPKVTVLDPADTDLQLDTSPGHRDSLLYMESLLRDVPPTGNELHLGHLAAMDVMDFQLDPALKALEQPRQRILIADAVGLGKTLEAGILMSELIRRGRGKRILVVTVKSMLTQFQKELWCRFSIPLVRLDSQGLHRIREHIPSNHNPFYHFDRAIISIDTLKQNNAFRTHVESAFWDIIVIDEAHNVAIRGGGRSQRARIAEVLAQRTDSLILLSATPHDGKARSFASLMNMLDPTAIANPDSYTRDEIDGLFVRRFKQDVQHQMGKAFPDREIAKAHATASPQEEAAYQALADLSFTRIDKRRHGGMLFKSTLTKSLFSSPAACLQTVDSRIKRLSSGANAAEYNQDIQGLRHLRHAVAAIDPTSFSKYQKLIQVISDKKHGFGWSKSKSHDRLVIFSERIETLHFLRTHLCAELKLNDDQVALLHGGLGDTDQQQIVESFGKTKSKMRLLLASDVAAEGLNLHYLCHRLIHFDMPWSLMVFQQRNGRIDRYGQEQTPQIVYMMTDAQNTKVAGDARILELLMERDDQAVTNISKKGDPSALTGVYNIDAQEAFTAKMMEDGLTTQQANARMESTAKVNPFELLISGRLGVSNPVRQKQHISLFGSDFDFVRTSLDRLADTEGLQRAVRADDQIIEITLPPDTEEARRRRLPGLDLRRRFKKLPLEILPADGVVVLTPDKATMQQAISDARREESAWPTVQYLWPINPVVQWCQDKGRAAFGRHTAPILTLLNGLDAREAVVVVSGLVPNRRSQSLVHRWWAVRFVDGAYDRIEDFGELNKRLKLAGRRLHNRNVPADVDALRALVPEAVRRTQTVMLERRQAFEDAINPKLQRELDRLEVLKARQLQQLELDFARKPSKTAERDKRQRTIDKIFDSYLKWVQDSMTTEPAPFLQVIAVMRPENGFGGVA